MPDRTKDLLIVAVIEMRAGVPLPAWKIMTSDHSVYYTALPAIANAARDCQEASRRVTLGIEADASGRPWAVSISACAQP